MMHTDKHLRRPVIDPLLLVLKSRRVLVALVALLVGILISLVPELAPLRSELLTLLLMLALALIGGYSVEDAAHASRDVGNTLPNDVRGQVRELVDSVLDEMLRSPELETRS